MPTQGIEPRVTLVEPFLLSTVSNAPNSIKFEGGACFVHFRAQVRLTQNQFKRTAIKVDMQLQVCVISLMSNFEAQLLSCEDRIFTA